jgi:hypothetical protein
MEITIDASLNAAQTVGDRVLPARVGNQAGRGGQSAKIINRASSHDSCATGSFNFQ